MVFCDSSLELWRWSQCFRASGSYVRTPAVMVQHWGLDNSMPNCTVHVTEQVRCVSVTPYLTHSVCSVQYKRSIRFQCTWWKQDIIRQLVKTSVFPLAGLPRVPSNLPIWVSASRLPLSLVTTQKSFPCFQGLFFLVCSVYYRAVLTHGINDRVCNETTVMQTPVCSFDKTAR